MLSPDSTIGILGGGQLGRMLALAAARLGFKCHVFAPSPDAAAFDVVHRVTCADYADNAALDRFAADVDVITYEFENVPAQTATFLSARTSVLPDPRVLAITQDRLTEKNFITGLGIATARFAEVSSPAELAGALDATGAPAILKTRRFGYDGKGQVRIRNGTDAASAWRQIGEQPAILEALVPFEREVSIVAARSRDGRIECFDLIENEHRDHILKFSRVPANVPDAVADDARRIAETIATAFDYVGVLAVEMFVIAEGGRHALLVNEIAPRVHNSGHWTIDGATVSQFEQHVRAVAGWPLVKPRRHGRIEMTNLIGAEVEDYAEWLTVPGASVHLYGKGAPRPGRKMGHVTRVLPANQG
ncbi:MAG TPA: 5-(carboxyamino)imidazole ribonucleotide synthase [Xanthobacteraceae bacterium]|nr:5-(carboxyamino)imidazole ribonucleotide synthase [Xanthobacteraceae bacterium]